MTTTILLADPQYVARVGLRSILSQHARWQIVGEVEKEEELYLFLQDNQPDIVIIDYKHEGKFGPTVIADVSARFPGIKMIAISDDDDKQSIFRVLESGVSSFLTKSCDAQEITDALQATIRGDKFYCTRILDALLEKSFGKTGGCAATPLSIREVEIVQLIAKGFIAKEIAESLHLSTHTVYTHRKNIMKKLQLHTPSELMLYAINHGLLENR
jgi:DNA-binding NarL/FixJ family response regulator